MGGGQNFQKFILIDFLAKLGNSKHFSFFFFIFWFGPSGGGQNFQKLFLIDFLAKLANSKHFLFFFSFFGGRSKFRVDRVGAVKIFKNLF